LIFLYASIALTLVVLYYTFRVRPNDLPEPVAPSPTHHLEVRKGAIYENLRDLNFEYRVGKLSDADYQRTKAELQTQLAGVLAEIDDINKKAGSKPAKAAPMKSVKPAAKSASDSSAPVANGNGNGQPAVEADASVETTPIATCPHCGASFDRPLKFCGECGKLMAAGVEA
jgi:hypothetical protein